ncbi:MAG: hypothetical protein N3A69_11365, partial [Leptospiraceae bacterium]|nr:hypothetical protein [Leptospiraceae bacterium]
KRQEEDYAFVKRVPVDENLKIENIIDPIIKKLFENAVKEKSLKEMKKEVETGSIIKRFQKVFLFI